MIFLRRIEKKTKNCFYRLHDIILRVNEMDFTQIEHQAAVDGLKAAGNQVHLVRFLFCFEQTK